MVGRGALNCSAFQGGGGRRAGPDWREGKKEAAKEEFSSLALEALAHYTAPRSLGLFQPLKCAAQPALWGKRRLAMGSPGLQPALLLPQVLLLLLALLHFPRSQGFPGRSEG